MEYTEEEAIMIVYHTMYNGPEHGSFVNALMKAWINADPHNFRKLAQAYPEIGQAMYAWRHFTEAFVRAAKERITLKEAMGEEVYQTFMRHYLVTYGIPPVEAITDFLEFWYSYVSDVVDTQGKSLGVDISDNIRQLEETIQRKEAP